MYYRYLNLFSKLLLLALLLILAIATINCDHNIIGSNSTLAQDLCYQKLDFNNHWQIYINSIAGTNRKNISNNPSDDAYSPLWSPDGKYIAFRYDREQTGGCDIYLYDVERDTTLNITANFGIEESAYPLLWSPDAQKIVYHYHKIGESAKYYIMRWDGAEKHKLFETEFGHITAFCKDGNNILWSQGQQLYTIDPATNVSQLVLDYLDYSAYPTWTDDYDPVSNSVLCHEDSSSWDAGATFLIKTIALNTNEVDTLVHGDKGTTLLRPVYSNDYSSVVYIARDYTNDVSLMIMVNNGMKIVLNRITDPTKSYGFYPIEFSPHNQYITYTVSESVGGDWVQFKMYVYVLRIAAKEAQYVDEGEDSHWNPLVNY